MFGGSPSLVEQEGRRLEHREKTPDPDVAVVGVVEVHARDRAAIGEVEIDEELRAEPLASPACHTEIASEHAATQEVRGAEPGLLPVPAEDTRESSSRWPMLPR